MRMICTRSKAYLYTKALSSGADFNNLWPSKISGKSLALKAFIDGGGYENTVSQNVQSIYTIVFFTKSHMFFVSVTTNAIERLRCRQYCHRMCEVFGQK